MTRQEALAELKDRVRCAEWVDEDYVDCVSTEALKVAIEALEREASTDPDQVSFDPASRKHTGRV